MVSIASCGFVLLAIEVLGERSAEQSRILQGLITGVGFIGGGAILKSGDSVRGTATAASLWNVGIIGAAVGFGSYDLGLIIALANFSLLVALTPMKGRRGMGAKVGPEPNHAESQSEQRPEVDRD